MRSSSSLRLRRVDRQVGPERGRHLPGLNLPGDRPGLDAFWIGHVSGKLEIASFPDGLGAGWRRFVGRRCDEGALVLTSDKTIQFVE